MLGFRTIRAQTCCQMATDHHKAMQMLEITLFGFANELIQEYCVYSKQNKIVPSVEGYFAWFDEVKNENVIFTSEVIFTYILSLYLFRAAAGRNNPSLILASRMKFAPLFYALNMTNYQELHCRDIIMHMTMPDDVKSLINQNQAFSCSGHPSKGEGGDFILEAKNRRTKTWMPPCIPSEDRWYRVCRNQDRLEKVFRCMISKIKCT
ncbi:unnamed protein product [Mytilus coruscus]|uniref:Uncharacterized protein n=1 Tax=Mytilus coruscus TaxID=42192 RepID=A0A6J8DJK1_MYTCO|nr:unnamed protein product [Mytilus coruscus]